jgi:hypothetical protein
MNPPLHYSDKLRCKCGSTSFNIYDIESIHGCGPTVRCAGFVAKTPSSKQIRCGRIMSFAMLVSLQGTAPIMEESQ